MSAVGRHLAVLVEGRAFGIPLERVEDVFLPQGLTRVPLAAPEIAGLLNLRGRIVTAVCLRRRLGLPPAGTAQKAVGVEAGGEAYALLVDDVGDVTTASGSVVRPPVVLDRPTAALSSGILRLDGQLLVVLDIDRVLDINRDALAA